MQTQTERDSDDGDSDGGDSDGSTSDSDGSTSDSDGGDSDGGDSDGGDSGGEVPQRPCPGIAVYGRASAMGCLLRSIRMARQSIEMKPVGWC